jgi:hypothetical protein
MRRSMESLLDAVKSFGRCVKEAARQAREIAENPERGGFGFREMRETEGGPPLFYTETCPEGIYLIGIVEDNTRINPEEERGDSKEDLPLTDGVIAYGSNGPVCVGTRGHVTPK